MSIFQEKPLNETSREMTETFPRASHLNTTNASPTLQYIKNKTDGRLKEIEEKTLLHANDGYLSEKKCIYCRGHHVSFQYWYLTLQTHIELYSNH